MIRVGVFGAGGRMGSTVCDAVSDAPDMELVAAVDPVHAGAESGAVRLAAEAHQLEVAGAEVAVDFTVLDAARENIRWCAAHGVHAVVGTTGFTEDELAEFAELFDASTANAAIVPNFAVGAVLMMRFAEMAAPFFETAEIIELHHDRKIDAPSGTAALTAQRMAAASKDWADDPTTTVVADGRARRAGRRDPRALACGCGGWSRTRRCCSARPGQTLSIRHDSYDRASFMPGVLLAVRKVAETPGLTIGLDALLGL